MIESRLAGAAARPSSVSTASSSRSMTSFSKAEGVKGGASPRVTVTGEYVTGEYVTGGNREAIEAPSFAPVVRATARGTEGTAAADVLDVASVGRAVPAGVPAGPVPAEISQDVGTAVLTTSSARTTTSSSRTEGMAPAINGARAAFVSAIDAKGTLASVAVVGPQNAGVDARAPIEAVAAISADKRSGREALPVFQSGASSGGAGHGSGGLQALLNGQVTIFLAQTRGQEQTAFAVNPGQADIIRAVRKYAAALEVNDLTVSRRSR